MISKKTGFPLTLKRFALSAAFLLSVPTVGFANLIDVQYGAGAGSFELGSFVNNGSGYMALSPGATTITGWTVGGPGDGVDWLIKPNWNAADGVHSVDLQHLTLSSISTTINTVTDAVYQLSFGAASLIGLTNTGKVSAGSLVDQAFATSFSAIGAAPGFGQSQTFDPFSFLFTATGTTTTITFADTGTSTTYGPVIDNVSVVAVTTVPEPASLALLGLGLAGLGFSRRRKA